MIEPQGAWSSARLALILSVLFVLVLVLAPPMIARALDQRGPAPAAAVAVAAPIPTQQTPQNHGPQAPGSSG